MIQEGVCRSRTTERQLGAVAVSTTARARDAAAKLNKILDGTRPPLRQTACWAQGGFGTASKKT